jgi:hypothetical protein
MKATSKRLLFWTPRVLCLLFAAFISIFALDVFEEGFGGWKTVVALLMHLIPTFLVLLVLAVSWRWEWVGALLFGGLAVGYVALFWGRFHWSAYAAISGPLCLVGLLFFFNWLCRGELHSHSAAHPPS